MKTSTDRMLTTHTGSLPRSKALSTMLVKREQRNPFDQAAFEADNLHRREPPATEDLMWTKLRSQLSEPMEAIDPLADQHPGSP